MMMMTDEERYDRTYVKIIPAPPSIRKLRKEWSENKDELNPTGQCPEGREFTDFYPMFFHQGYIGDVKFATLNYGQDFRTRRYTREELGYGYENPDSKPHCVKHVLRQESDYRAMWRKESEKYKDAKLPTIKISWDGRLI